MNKRPELKQAFEYAVPPGDNMERSVCTACGFVDYQNPKIVVGSVVTWRENILLCRRAIEPHSGYWTLPAGYLELNETPEDGARREAKEEALAEIEIDRVLAIYAIARISQVQIIYRARLNTERFAAGPESAEVRLFSWEDIPWADLAFPSVGWALRQHREVFDSTNFAPFSNPAEGL